MSLEQTIQNEIESKKGVLHREVARLLFAQNLFCEITPHLPHSLEKYFTFQAIWTGYGSPPEKSTYNLYFQTKENLAEEKVSQAFGTLTKVAAALAELGWEVEPQPRVEAANGVHALDIEVKAHRSPTTLCISFLHLPESEQCKLVEEQVLVPERYETKMSVVCEGEPVRLVDSPVNSKGEV